MSVREETNRALRLCEEGLISYRTLAEMALKWMSEDEVAEMLKANELLYDEEAEEDDEQDAYARDEEANWEAQLRCR